MAINSLPEPPFPTPSPFSFSVTSSRWSSRPLNHHASLFLRFLSFISSFISAFTLVASSWKKENHVLPGFSEYPELVYIFVVTTLCFIYTAILLLKGVLDIVHRGVLIPDEISEYLSFVLDQLVGYLLVSSSSVAIPVIKQLEQSRQPIFLLKAAIISVVMSFAAFLATAICTLFSGYKLCKRIVW